MVDFCRLLKKAFKAFFEGIYIIMLESLANDSPGGIVHICATWRNKNG